MRPIRKVLYYMSERECGFIERDLRAEGYLRNPGTVEVCPNRLLTIGACYVDPENAQNCDDDKCPLRKVTP